MQPTTYVRRLAAAGAVAITLLAAPAAAAPVAGTGHGTYARLHPLADLSARRLATADLVAAAKRGTGSSVDDPAREQQVLDSVARQARQAREAGGDPGATVRIFRDQIEANKQVQRALHSRWDTDASAAPKERPDLEQVREAINRVNADLVHAIAHSPAARAAPSCAAALTAAERRVRHERQLDGVHATALTHALRAVCATGL
ncbi:gamma subclass chorismate mutase AroQ [Streptomyces niveus]|uniref:gamma subclass chorismate mutase AroQ n=1 Tax=Streptomyces niveus TaxID=193462 RepID=UPI00363E6A8E